MMIFGPLSSLALLLTALTLHYVCNACPPLVQVNTYGAFGSVTKERLEVIVEGTADAVDVGTPPRSWTQGAGKRLPSWLNFGGAFGSSSTADYAWAGSNATLAQWRRFDWRCKPNDPTRRPCLITPWHYRLDWVAWFLPFDVGEVRQGNADTWAPWYAALVRQLLLGAAATGHEATASLHVSNSAAVHTLFEADPFAGEAPPRFVRARIARYRYSTLEESEQAGSPYWVVGTPSQYTPPVSLAMLGMEGKVGGQALPCLWHNLVGLWTVAAATVLLLVLSYRDGATNSGRRNRSGPAEFELELPTLQQMTQTATELKGGSNSDEDGGEGGGHGSV